MNRILRLAALFRAHPVRAALVLGLALAAVTGVWRFRARQIDHWLVEAQRALDRGETERAASRLDAILRRDPSHALARLYRGQLARDAGNEDAALEYWAAVGDEPPRVGATARYLHGMVLMQRGRAREAEARLLRALELNPDYLAPHERLVELYVAQMRRDETREQLAAVHRLREWKIDEVVMYTVAGERVTPVKDGIRLMQQFLDADPDDLTSGLALARYLIADDRGDEALEWLSRWGGRFRHDAQIAAAKGDYLLERRDFPAARGALAECPIEAGSHVSLWHSCGKYWLETGEWAKAADCLGQVVARDRENLPARYQLGTALSRNGQAEAAAEHLKRAELLDKLQREALRIPRRDRRQSGALTGIVLEAGRLLGEIERYDEAAWWYEQACVLEPDNETARAALERAQLLATATRGRPAVATAVASAALVDRVRIETVQTGPLPVASRSSDAAGRIALRDVAAEAGIDFQYFSGQTGLKYLVESMGGSVAVLDYDGDGWPDLYFAQGSRLPYDPGDFTHLDRLYRNRRDGTFEDVTGQSGLGDNRYGQGCAVGDYDNDGDPDLFVVNFGRSILYRNNGDGTFDDVTDETGIHVDKWSSSAAFADLDRDGNLDLYVVTYVDSLRVCRAEDNHITTCDPQNFNAEQDVLYRNRGDGTLEDVSAAAGILAPDGKGLGIVTADLDDDGWPDIYVANDGTPNFLFHNLGLHDGPKFREEAMLSGAAVNGEGQAEAGMGIACADFNGDGRLDLLVTNFYLETATLYVNLGGGLFQDGTRAAGLDAATRNVLGFGVQAIDFDRDGWPDVIMANGHIDDYRFRNEPWKMPPQLFRNRGAGSFVEVSRAAGEYFHGEYLGRGVARLDWNRDGLPDAIIVHQDRPVALLKNETPDPGRGVVVELHGVESNRDAIGARLRVTSGGRTQVVEICGGDGFFCSNERRQVIGLGGADRIDQLEIDWPGGRRDRWSDLSAGATLIVVEGRAPLVHPLGGRQPE